MFRGVKVQYVIAGDNSGDDSNGFVNVSMRFVVFATPWYKKLVVVERESNLFEKVFAGLIHAWSKFVKCVLLFVEKLLVQLLVVACQIKNLCVNIKKCPS